jgi:hypothetical protein
MAPLGRNGHWAEKSPKERALGDLILPMAGDYIG